MLRLPNVTIVGIINSNNYFDKTANAINYSLSHVKPEKSIIICPQKNNAWEDIESVEVDMRGDYSYWILKNLYKYVDTEFCLIQQWDSAVLDNSKWDEQFLEYDYIGAPWEMGGDYRVGNGGFSLRSKKILEESSKIAELLPQGKFILGNEDYFLCVTARKFLESKGIKFPSVELARKFSVERPINEAPHEYNNLSTYQSFGFHGDFNKAGMIKINKE